MRKVAIQKKCSIRGTKVFHGRVGQNQFIIIDKVVAIIFPKGKMEIPKKSVAAGSKGSYLVERVLNLSQDRKQYVEMGEEKKLKSGMRVIDIGGRLVNKELVGLFGSKKTFFIDSGGWHKDRVFVEEGGKVAGIIQVVQGGKSCQGKRKVIEKKKK